MQTDGDYDPLAILKLLKRDINGGDISPPLTKNLIRSRPNWIADPRLKLGSTRNSESHGP